MQRCNDATTCRLVQLCQNNRWNIIIALCFSVLARAVYDVTMYEYCYDMEWHEQFGGIRSTWIFREQRTWWDGTATVTVSNKICYRHTRLHCYSTFYYWCNQSILVKGSSWEKVSPEFTVVGACQETLESGSIRSSVYIHPVSDRLPV